MLKKHLGFLFNLIAICLFVPGIILPMISLSMEMTATLSQSALSSTLLDKELSILATVNELWQDNRFLVAVLIFVFSICVPILKTSLLCCAYFIKDLQLEARILSWLNTIGKWSMADVFVVAVFLAVLSTNHSETSTPQSFSLFGFNMDLLISSQTLSNAGIGFYCFVGYCLLSLLGTQLCQSSLKHRKANSENLVACSG
ncbi:paraquat-inducible protein A [Catenovulum adriaticum]|uniref:Paraquat-inducible protein A n=1 Tax=Catenovulum adriaticum TaxID=2984846 RepID=A0ABY7AJB6_9ALTE|nr:paraquat-inducible protein A [Catenovulum sp. TS8]WAJ69549.1 paraquat-inducible protein A [Catenovulum sp. TS8]